MAAPSYDLLNALIADTPKTIHKSRLQPRLSADALGFLRRLRESAFGELDVTGWRPNFRGWTNVRGLQQAISPVLAGELGREEVVVVEVGAWRGGSARAIATALQRAPALTGAKLHVVSVDTWLGAPEFWKRCCIDAADRGAALEKKDGFPRVFHTFARNMKVAGLGNISAPLPISSREGAHVLAHWGIPAAAIFVDAAHETHAALEDMLAFWPLLRRRGVLFGDDAQKKSVMRAVRLFRRQLGGAASNISWHTRSKSIWSLRRLDG